MTFRSDVTAAIAHLKMLAPGPADDTLDKVIAKVRLAMIAYGDATARLPLEDVTIIPCHADGVPGEWIVPVDAIEDERIVHCHGGSLIAGSLASHRPMLSAFAQAARRPILSIDYRLAPEHLYPAAHLDCQKALAWAEDNGPHGRTIARRIALSGDSSGAILAMAVCANAIENRLRTPDCVVLFGPVALASARADRPDRETDPIINNEAMQALALYAGQTPLEHPQLSPLNCDDAIVRLFPPVLLQVGAPEFLLFDSLTLAHRFAGLNKRAVLSIWPEMPHLWHHFTTHLPEAYEALAEAAAFIGSTRPPIAF